jgi:predicted hotdog family 3-hydroxylacyl-ACP dehydratase
MMVTDIKLPAYAGLLVPHRPPFLLVDRLLEFAGQTGVVESVIAPDNLFISDEGLLNEIALVELLAQSAAAVKGYSDLKEGKEIKKGFLVDIREFYFKERCCKGDIIHISIEIAKSFSGFSVINGHLVSRGKELAAGTLKLWVPDESEHLLI